MRIKIWYFALICATQLSFAQVAPELVMREGMRIEASQDGSSISVTAGKGFDRLYEFNGCKLRSNMHARGGRWFGANGIYDAAGSSGWSFFTPAACNGITRTVVEEAQIHFDDTQFAYEWLRRQQRGMGQDGKTVWTNDGLLVAWNTVPGRVQLNVDVYLMCINGRRPTHLDGATDSAIKLVANLGQPIHQCALVGKDDINQGRKQMEEDWAKVDGWIAESKARREHAENARNSK